MIARAACAPGYLREAQSGLSIGPKIKSGMKRSGRKKTKKGPGSGVDRASNSCRNLRSESLCRLRCLLLGYAFCLRAFLSLDNFEFDVIALLETFVAF